MIEPKEKQVERLAFLLWKMLQYFQQFTVRGTVYANGIP